MSAAPASIATGKAATDKAQILVEALPYIRSYRGQTVVVKIGGEALADPASRRVVAQDLSLLSLVGVRLVVVHGGGPQVSEAMRRAGVEPLFVSGLRVTDDVSMQIVQEVLIGAIGPALVADLCASGAKGVALSGMDGGTLKASAVEDSGVTLGRVGRIVEVDQALLVSLLEDGFTPVIASVAPDAEGRSLNVNADAAAAAVAGALSAAKLVYLTNVEGLYRDLGDAGSLISELHAGELDEIVLSLSDGMRPKMASALEALRAGVGKVHVLDGRVEHALLLEIFTDEGVGTQVLP